MAYGAMTLSDGKEAERHVETNEVYITPDYFQALQIPVLQSANTNPVESNMQRNEQQQRPRLRKNDLDISDLLIQTPLRLAMAQAGSSPSAQCNR